jgi:hypothetical protein
LDAQFSSYVPELNKCALLYLQSHIKVVAMTVLDEALRWAPVFVIIPTEPALGRQICNRKVWDDEAVDAEVVDATRIGSQSVISTQ